MSNELRSLTITGQESLTTIEEALLKLASGELFKLRLPASLNTRGALGVEVAIIQLIGTWLKSSMGQKVFHSYQQPDEKSFKQLCSSMYGIAALSLSDEIWDVNKNRQPRSTVLSEAKKSIEALRNKKFSDVFKSRYFGIPCIKKPTYDREFDMPVYNSATSEVIDSGPFYHTFSSILEDVINGENRLTMLDRTIGVRDLSEVLWELFKNTHDHARKDCNDNDLPLNYRGLIIQQQDITNEYLDIWCGLNPSAAQNAFRLNCAVNSKKHHILDISIVDFGEGFVELARSKSGLEDGRSILLWCLGDGNSRLSERSRGEGLTKVLSKVADHGGWIRIRTGNLVLEKTYANNTERGLNESDIRIVGQSAVGTSIHISVLLNAKMPTSRD